jgi:hypothetical protein
MNNFDQDKILEDIFDKNTTSYAFEVLPKTDALIRSITASDYLEINAAASALKGTKMSVLHEYAIEKLSRVLLMYKNNKFNTAEQAKEFIKSLPLAVVDKILMVQSEFEKFIAKVVNPESMDQAFFDQGGLPIKPEVSPEVSTLEKKAVSGKQ